MDFFRIVEIAKDGSEKCLMDAVPENKLDEKLQEYIVSCDGDLYFESADSKRNCSCAKK